MLISIRYVLLGVAIKVLICLAFVLTSSCGLEEPAPQVAAPKPKNSEPDVQVDEPKPERESDAETATASATETATAVSTSTEVDLPAESEPVVAAPVFSYSTPILSSVAMPDSEIIANLSLVLGGGGQWAAGQTYAWRNASLSPPLGPGEILVPTIASGIIDQVCYRVPEDMQPGTAQGEYSCSIWKSHVVDDKTVYDYFFDFSFLSQGNALRVMYAYRAAPGAVAQGGGIFDADRIIQSL